VIQPWQRQCIPPDKEKKRARGKWSSLLIDYK
jgi:hypothetical protein